MATVITERRKAYSYIRFSTPEQKDGDSLRRQTEAARTYAARNNLDLDETLTFYDPAMSAYLGRNAEVGKLGVFLDGVKAGVIPQGAYLLVESLDRISRQTVRRAVRTMEDIVAAGVNLVDLSDNGRLYSTDTLDNDGMAFLLMAIRFMRAHEESAMKSRRLSAVYEAKRTRARRTDPGEPFTRMLPAWLRWDETTRKHCLIPERADLIRSIFQKADEGWGQHRIAQWLNEQGIPTWGGRGNQRRAECWHRSYVKKLLTNSAVGGTFTPHQRLTDAKGTRKRKPLDPIEGYFPAVVDRELFERVASRVCAPAARGRNAKTVPASIFAGVLRCPSCGGVVTRAAKGDHVYLVCSRANRRGVKACRYLAVRYHDVEHAVRDNIEAIVYDAPRGLGTEEMDRQIEGLEELVSKRSEQANALADELAVERSEVVRRRLKEKEAELERAKEALRDLRARRDALAAPYVHRRLETLKDALSQYPLSIALANKALKEAVSQIVLDPEAAMLSIHWHHTTVSTDVPFYSRHIKMFPDEAEETP
jgi:DNA invertase Pin-like site-specific DNA recombinase